MDGGTCVGSQHPPGWGDQWEGPFPWELGWKRQTPSPGAEGRLPLLPSTHHSSYQASGARGLGGSEMQTHRPLHQGWPRRSQTGRRAGLLCLWEEAAHSHLLGSLACGHEQRCCLPAALWGLSEGPSMFPPSSPIFQPPSSLIRDGWPMLGGVMEGSFQPRRPARPQLTAPPAGLQLLPAQW